MFNERIRLLYNSPKHLARGTSFGFCPLTAKYVVEKLNVRSVFARRYPQTLYWLFHS